MRLSPEELSDEIRRASIGVRIVEFEPTGGRAVRLTIYPIDGLEAWEESIAAQIGDWVARAIEERRAREIERAKAARESRGETRS